MAMTEIKIEVKKSTTKSVLIKNGIYMATFVVTNDRILLYKNDVLEDVLGICGLPARLKTQMSLDESNYRDLKKVKKMTIEVELE